MRVVLTIEYLVARPYWWPEIRRVVVPEPYQAGDGPVWNKDFDDGLGRMGDLQPWGWWR